MSKTYTLTVEDSSIRVYHQASFLLEASTLKLFINTESACTIGDDIAIDMPTHYSLDWVIRIINSFQIKRIEELGVTTQEGIKVSDCSLVISNPLEDSYLTLDSTNLIVNKNLSSLVIFGNTERLIDISELRPIEDRTLKELMGAFS